MIFSNLLFPSHDRERASPQVLWQDMADL